MNLPRSAAFLAVICLLGLSPSTALAAEPNDPGDGLVVRLEALSDISPFGPIVSLHADGRLITVPPAMEAGSEVQLLQPDEVAAIRQLIADTGLFGPDAPATAEYLPRLRPGKEPPGRGLAQQRIVVGRPGGSVSAIFEVVSDYEADVWFASPEAERLAPLHELLWSLFERTLPDSEDPGRVAYTPKRYQLTLTGDQGVALDGVVWPLAVSPESLPVTVYSARFQGAWPSADRLRCALLTPDEAALLADTFSERLPSGITDRMMIEVRGTDGATHQLRLEGLLPDEPGCASRSPDTALPSSGVGDLGSVVGGFLLLAMGAVAVVRRAIASTQRG